LGGADAQGVGGSTVDLPAGGLDLVQRRPDLLQQEPSCLDQEEPAAGALKQGTPEPPLELYDLLADGAWRHTQFRCRRGDSTRARHALERRQGRQRGQLPHDPFHNGNGQRRIFAFLNLPNHQAGAPSRLRMNTNARGDGRVTSHLLDDLADYAASNAPSQVPRAARRA
jgi:hypothetical protein